MEELNELAARVWRRVARGEAYDTKPAPKPKPQQRPNNLLPMLLLLALTKGRTNN